MKKSLLVEKLVASTDKIEAIQLEMRDLKGDIRKLRTSQDELRIELLTDHPHPIPCDWFSENQIKLSKLCSGQLNGKKYFADDLAILFNFFGYTLVCLTEKPIQRHIEKFRFVYNKDLYINSFGILKEVALDILLTPDFMFFAKRCDEFIELISLPSEKVDI